MYFLNFAESYFLDIARWETDKMFGFTSLFDTQQQMLPHHWLQKHSGLNNVCLWDRIIAAGKIAKECLSLMELTCSVSHCLLYFMWAEMPVPEFPVFWPWQHDCSYLILGRLSGILLLGKAQEMMPALSMKLRWTWEPQHMMKTPWRWVCCTHVFPDHLRVFALSFSRVNK